MIHKLHFVGAFETVLKPGSNLRVSEIRDKIETERIQYETKCRDIHKSKGDIFWCDNNNKPAETELSKLDRKYLMKKRELAIQERRYWRYERLTIRGLILYLYIENLIHNEKKRKPQGRKRDNRNGSKEKREHDTYRQNIRNVLSNPKTTEKIPFLKYWAEFKNHGFDVINSLTSISSELINQLHVDAEEDNYLIRRATERYFIDVNNYFYEYDVNNQIIPSEFFLKDDELKKEKELRIRLNEYRKTIIHLQKTWIFTQLQNLERLQEIWT